MIVAIIMDNRIDNIWQRFRRFYKVTCVKILSWRHFQRHSQIMIRPIWFESPYLHQFREAESNDMTIQIGEMREAEEGGSSRKKAAKLLNRANLRNLSRAAAF